MNYTEYEKYMDEFKAVIDENERRIETKFAECEKWVAENLINCGCVYHKHSGIFARTKIYDLDSSRNYPSQSIYSF